MNRTCQQTWQIRFYINLPFNVVSVGKANLCLVDACRFIPHCFFYLFIFIYFFIKSFVVILIFAFQTICTCTCTPVPLKTRAIQCGNQVFTKCSHYANFMVMNGALQLESENLERKNLAIYVQVPSRIFSSGKNPTRRHCQWF